jgi:hypothetical protein
VDLTSIEATSGSRTVPALSGKTVVDGDKNGNGVTEISACFSKEAMRVLFAGQPTGDYDVTISGDLVGGGSFEGTVSVHVVNNGSFTASVLAESAQPEGDADLCHLEGGHGEGSDVRRSGAVDPDVAG